MQPAGLSAHPKEPEWIAGLVANDLASFRQLYDWYVLPLWRFAALSVASDVAEDIVQDVLFDLWSRRATLEIRDGLTVYLVRAVRYQVWRHQRHNAFVYRTETERPWDAPPGMGAPEPSPDEAVFVGELHEAVVTALESLTELQRSILTLRWTHGMTYEQIATALSITSEAARQGASRTQRVIRPLLQRFRGFK